MSPASHDGTVSDVQTGLAVALRHAASLGLPVPELAGQLYRPQIVLAGARAASYEPDAALWRAALAIQYAHEASLLHDDVIDGAATRRGRPTAARQHGTARALIEGDHLLTAAYRLAAETGSSGFMRLFANGVERTVRGEKRQAAARGTRLRWEDYREIVAGKSGELFGCAFAAAPTLRGDDPAPWVEVGRRLGSVYQMVDDLLDYCPNEQTGKSPLGDYRAGLWTWIRIEADGLADGRSPAEVAAHLFQPLGASSPMRRALERLTTEMHHVEAAANALGNDGAIVRDLLGSWLGRASKAVGVEEAALARTTLATGIHALTGGRTLANSAERLAYFGDHGRTFRFAARLFPSAALEQVATVYAFCRVTDDLVDRSPDPSVPARAAMLDAWEAAAHDAYRGNATGIPVLDAAMGAMAARHVPFRYAADLIAGARMDLGPVMFAAADDLTLYTYRVASVVGLWLTELFGVRDPAVLERAAAMGHAMQLTNILRDVGEDLDRDRLYIPQRLLSAHGLARAHLEQVRVGNAPIPPGYAALCEDLLQVAERQYAYAFEALPDLPAFFRRPVAVAARAYEGIHEVIRRNGYDNLRRRAFTSLPQKVSLGLSGLRSLYALRRHRTLRPLTRIVPA